MLNLKFLRSTITLLLILLLGFPTLKRPVFQTTKKSSGPWPNSKIFI